MSMTCSEVLASASAHLQQLSGQTLDLLTISKPESPEAAVNLSKVVSKLSPLLGNLIEFDAVAFLNRQQEYRGLGQWRRQDPGFPDAIFSGSHVKPEPGFEIKAWFPLATEITARFKDSQNHFREDQTNVCMLAWLPDQLIFGKPKLADVCIVSGRSVAEARDNHYHNPPDYLVLEPEDTTTRTRNLQQTNTNGYKWQGTSRQFAEAQKLVESWGSDGTRYEPEAAYQAKLRQLIGRFPYRLDTNFAKMDRIGHGGIEEFKARVLATKILGLSIAEWSRLIFTGSDETVRELVAERFRIQEEGIDDIPS